MRDWIVIVLTALASLVIGFWALRRRSSVTDQRLTAGSSPRHDQIVAGPAATSAEGRPQPATSAPAEAIVPNTTIVPFAEHRLVATLSFDGPPGVVPLRRGVVVIGRHSTDDVRVPDVRVSRHHAKLVVGGDGGLEIHNLTAVRSEPNPMLVNGVDRERAALGDGDVITLGGVSFKLQLAAA